MSEHYNQSEPAKPAMSEKARRLFEAHDRVVAECKREPAEAEPAYAYRLAG